MTPNQIQNTVLLALAFLALFSTAEVLYHKLKVKAETTRKFVHASSGLLTFTFPILVVNQWLVLALCGSFFLILLLSLKFNLLPSINAVDRVTRGSILFPAVIYLCYLLALYQESFIYFYLPILILSLSDPSAALGGKRWPIRKINIGRTTKSIGGSLAFFSVSLALCLCYFYCFHPLKIDDVFGLSRSVDSVFITSLCVALWSTLAEMISGKGYDNFSIPLSVSVVLIFFMS